MSADVVDKKDLEDRCYMIRDGEQASCGPGALWISVEPRCT